ncbi:MAG: hypothetical protein HYS58_02985, partial [Elusimicrobia bacterium]|nr:hypothetical protein [Elusimicrobiota bacterium]
NDDFSQLTIASLQKNNQTRTIDSYSLAGLRSGTTYQLIIFTEDDDTFVPPERLPAGGAGISISTDTSNFNLTFAQSRPEVFLKGFKTGTRIGGIDQYRFEFQCTQALRNDTLAEKADNYWSTVVTISSSIGGNGALSEDPQESNPLSPDRKKVKLLYLPTAATQKVTLQFRSPVGSLQPGTTSNFVINNSFDFYLGLDGQNFSRISGMRGGRVELEGDNSQAIIPAGAFVDSGGNALSLSTNVTVGLQKATDVGTATGAVAGRGAPAFGSYSEDSRVPPNLLNAMRAMREIQTKSAAQNQGNAKAAPKAVASRASEVADNVLGSFYDFFLPSGVRRTFATSKEASIRLAYSSSVTNGNNVNVYFYNDTGSTVTYNAGQSVPPGAYGLENSGRAVDDVNRTITVNVGHFTVFVVVNATSSVLGSAASLGALSTLTVPDTLEHTGAEIEAFNFPNPFNPNEKGFNFVGTKTSGQATLRTDAATAIRYALPKNLGSGPLNVTLYIYDVSGSLVKTVDLGTKATGRYHYTDWDGKNDDGQTVASGVYIGRLKIEGTTRTKFFKMAVIK